MRALTYTGAPEGRAQPAPAAIPALLRRGARAVAAGRVGLGLTALAGAAGALAVRPDRD